MRVAFKGTLEWTIEKDTGSFVIPTAFIKLPLAKVIVIVESLEIEQ